MTFFSTGQMTAALLLVLLLSGCITSTSPIIGMETAVAPFETGTWQQETFNSEKNAWEPAEKVLIVTRAGNAYSITAPGEKSVLTASFHPLSGTKQLMLVLEGKGEDGKPAHFYALANSEADGIHAFDADCAQTMGDALTPFRFTGDRFTCSASDRAGVEAFLGSRTGKDLSFVGRFRRLGP